MKVVDRIVTRGFEKLGRLPRSFLVILCVLAMGGTVALDHVTGRGVSLFVFYLLPISVAGWFVGRAAGLFVATAYPVSWSVILVTEPTTEMTTALWNVFMRLSVLLAFVYLISRMKQAAIVLDREIHFAREDYLTGIPNRRSFFEFAEHEIKRLNRYPGPFTVISMDIDNFKSVNDSLGHAAGDALLRSVGQTVQAAIRSSDMCARLGGDEFVLFLPEADRLAAEAVVKKIRKALDAIGGEWAVPLTFSFGAVTFTRPAATVDEALRKADEALYSAKQAGRNTYRHNVWQGQRMEVSRHVS
jgi:diguanylate cyclase (GGDEF)-like protein